MDTLEAIRTRRSMREFEETPVDDAEIEDLLRAAMQAPSAGNARAWHFVVLTDPDLLDQVPSIHPHAGMTPDAGWAVLVCGDSNLEKYPGNWIADCSAATQNLLLAAHAKGFGAVWTGVFPEKDRMQGFRELLGLPDHVLPLALVPVGRPAEAPAPEDRYEAAKVHRNGW